MSETSKKKPKSRRDDFLAEYEFDYRKSRPNRFVSQISEDAITVVLEPDVAQVFHSSASVNRLLRSVISALPERRRRLRVVRRRAD